MRIVLNLNIKYNGGGVIVTPTSSPVLTPTSTPIPTLTPTPTLSSTLTLTPTPTVNNEFIEFTDTFYKIVRNTAISEIYLEEGKTYVVNRIFMTNLSNRKLKIHSGPKRATIIFGVENYTPVVHGNQDGILFMMQHNSELIIDNVNICQPKQLQTVQYFNPRILYSLPQPSVKFTAIIRNCDTTVMGNNGGFGLGLFYGGIEENHVALINFKHYGVGLMDAKNSYANCVMYVTMRDVLTYAREDANLSKTDFQHTASLKDNVLSFDGSVYSLTAGYNWNWQDNDSYIVLYDRFTFFLDGYKTDTIVSNNQFKLRQQAKGNCEVSVLDSKRVYSNLYELHVGDKFSYNGIEYTVIEKDRIDYPWFDPRTTEAKAEPDKSRSIVYTLNTSLPITTGKIIINYLANQIEFTNKPITLLYKANGGFKTTLTTKYRENNMLFTRGIGHLSYNHSDISMDASNVKHLGFYRGSEKGNGKSLIWNLYNCEGFEESGTWFNPSLPVTNIPNLPLPKRIDDLI
jgi:hypothetical protein